MAKAIGYILWEGKSKLDGKPIAVIATMSSSNIKTGKPGKKNMVQTWIIRTDIEPHIAAANGDDVSVCGDCKHRPTKDNTCYVTLFQAPLAIFRAFHRGAYSRNLLEFYAVIKSRKVRFGAYGDPAAAPTKIWAKIALVCLGITGYTHQWARPGFDRKLLNFVMASVDNPKEAKKANARYFRVKSTDSPALPGEVECLSDSKGIKCSDCLVCDGGTKGKSIYINVHGSKASNFNSDIIAMS